ncbi:cupin domain-containing protein [Micromonospora sp. NPDC004540]|uniref:cupin domain-containing protein n=1 Tax=Micromonospora sp. NPDC004540 TaxID=3154457 RepID=UPI0033A9EB3F
MSPLALSVLTEEQLTLARATGSGRSARTVHSGTRLRQTVVALVAGHALAKHASPGDATLQVLRGRVRLVVQDRSWAGSAGDLLVIPDARHALHADEDAVVLLTVARG